MKRHVSSLFALVTVFLLVAAGTGIAQDGSIAAWGDNGYGQCDVPEPNEGFTAIAGGYAHSLGLKDDGSIVAWGDNGYGQCNVPAPNEDFTAVAGIGNHSLGLKEDGSIVAWGNNVYGQCNVPAPNEGFVAVAGGVYHSLGLKADGSIVAWGDNGYGQCNVPEPNEGFTAVAGGWLHSLGLKEDGSIVAWGANSTGQCDVPEPNEGFTAVAAGAGHSLGLKDYGSILAWGHNGYGQCDVPAPNECFAEVAGGWWYSLGLTGMIVITQPDASTTWTHFDTDLPVEWKYYVGSSVSIVLYKASLPITVLASSINNEGSWIYGGPVPMSLVPGNDYRICIVDDLEYSCWSEYFTIAASEGQHVITVDEPNSSTKWTQLETDLPVSWEYPALPRVSDYGSPDISNPDNHRFIDSGENVAIFLYNGATLIDTLTLSTSNTGSWVYAGPVPEEWEPGNGYLLYIVDDLGNYGWSDDFEIVEFVPVDPREAIGLLVFRLFPISPNPSSGQFAVGYSVPHASDVTIGIYDVTGRFVYSAAGGEHAEGLYDLQLSGFSAGLYFCRMQAESFSATERFVVVR